MKIDGFKIYKTKYYVIGVDMKDVNKRHVYVQCNNKEQAYIWLEDCENVERKIYGKLFTDYWIVKGEQIPIWFR
jgi:hypothetical protein